MQLIVAAAIGTVAGLAVFYVSHVAGRNLFLLTGALAGVVVVIATQAYRTSANLTEVRITIPQFSELRFLVNNDSRLVAWKLFIESATRIATQPLDDDTGLIREALSSLHSLFSTTRDVLKAGRPTTVGVPGTQTVEHLAVTMLNWELRPLLSKWHPRLRHFETSNPEASEVDWPEALTCRQELREAQARLREYALGFARLAGVRDAKAMIGQVSNADQLGDFSL